MRCATCGKTVNIGDVEIESLQCLPDGQIGGAILVETDCDNCGHSETKLNVEVEVQMPAGHGGKGHELGMGFEGLIRSGSSYGFPAKISCSCGGLDAQGFVTIRHTS